MSAYVLTAHMRPLGMSALPPLSKHDRTSVQPILDCCPIIATGVEATKCRFSASNGAGRGDRHLVGRRTSEVFLRIVGLTNPRTFKQKAWSFPEWCKGNTG